MKILKMGFRRSASPYKRHLEINEKTYSLKQIKDLKKIGNRLSRWLKKRSPRYLSDSFEWFNNLPNTAVAFIIVFVVTLMFFMVHYFFTPDITATTTTVTTLLNQWDNTVNNNALFILGLMYYVVYKQAITKYDKKVQGKIKQ